MRSVPENVVKDLSDFSKPPFSIRGAPNVVIETVKRGEDDSFEKTLSKQPKTLILRLYEAFGGHAQAFLRVSGMLNVNKAFETNLLEDNLLEQPIFQAHENGDDGDTEMKLDFRGFEIKTIKLVLV